MPPGLVEAKLDFDKNPRLATVVGFFVATHDGPPQPINNMSKTIESAKKSASARRPEVGPAMKGSEIVIACLEREGVDTIFAYPGGASMEFHQALTKST